MSIESKESNWESLEQALVLINQKRRVEVYHVIKEVTKENNLESNFLGFIERQMAEWLSQNPDIMDKVKTKQLTRRDVSNKLLQDNINRIDNHVLTIANILKNNFKNDILKLMTFGTLSYCLNKHREDFHVFVKAEFWDCKDKSLNQKCFNGIPTTELEEIFEKLRKICYEIYTELDQEPYNEQPFITLECRQDTVFLGFYNKRMEMIRTPDFVKRCKNASVYDDDCEIEFYLN